MEFYYHHEIAAFQPKCPPEDYVQIERVTYRWVFDSIDDERNFKAQAEKNPNILNDKSDIGKCECYALSFHISAEASKEHFNIFLRMSKKAYARLGTNIAVGNLEKEDGVAANVEENGHFNFHHVKEHNFTKKFEIKEQL
jgi:hypothetical protein